ncbi:MAG: hypothetical protein ACOX1V_03355 [Candidatus Iainarchaeum sp.]
MVDYSGLKRHISIIMDISTNMDRWLFVINIVSKKRFQILQKILEKKEFTQYGLKKELKLGMSIVNDTINTLLDKEFIKKQEKKYVLIDEKGLLDMIAFLKPLKKDIKLQINTSLTKKEVQAKLPKEAILCLESALEQYTNYYESNRVACYLPAKVITKLTSEFFVPGNKTELIIMEANPQLTEKEINSKQGIKYTNSTRTIIDLYCDNKAFLADKIIRKAK